MTPAAILHSSSATNTIQPSVNCMTHSIYAANLNEFFRYTPRQKRNIPFNSGAAPLCSLLFLPALRPLSLLSFPLSALSSSPPPPFTAIPFPSELSAFPLCGSTFRGCEPHVSIFCICVSPVSISCICAFFVSISCICVSEAVFSFIVSVPLSMTPIKSAMRSSSSVRCVEKITLIICFSTAS